MAAVLSLAADAGGQLCAGHCAGATGAGDAAGGANSRPGVLAFVVMIVLSRHSAGGGSKASVLSQRKK